ncbi:conserved membrane protein of unknown function [Candidatus Filomicrobium marinum]|uniref:Uncharacterized protein n=1 Tax=Candidatus Filomicrobium marinum TaxID=1608628 RepID=A0A0D6J9G8_9HYPH|nr:hypothetical protein [Candidatus Filomicrobium marinum]CFW98384.1 conserved membrane protein of unknown function [Candidatus Filomicrobium marinum]CPR14890.1 conserved membrane protein of unknown function [Candidatus Filomicrobium marinum]
MASGMRLKRLKHFVSLVMVIGLVLTASVNHAGANWLTKLLKEAGDAGVDAGRIGSKLAVTSLDDAASVVSKLPHAPGSVALATHATPEGHWKFVNRKGEIFTAGNADEMTRVVPALAPELAGSSPGLALYLSEETLFTQRQLLRDLPEKAKLHVVVDGKAYPVLRRVGPKDSALVEVRPNVVLEAQDRTLFKEAIWQLSRNLSKADVRILSMTEAGPRTLGASRKFDKAGRSVLVEPIDPNHVITSLDALRGQTVVVTGRVEGNMLNVKPISGISRNIPLENLKSAAAANDINLVVLATSSPAQPGSRNWFWQSIEVSGLRDALKRATYADFLDALGAQHGKLELSATKQSSSRIRIDAVPYDHPPGTQDMFGDILGEVVSNVTGNVATAAVEAHVNSRERQTELDLRIIPNIPSTIQFAYLFSLVAGLIGFNVVRDWWARVWPKMKRESFANTAGYYATRILKLVVFLIAFMPLVGVPAALVSIIQQLWAIVTLPWRILTWIFGFRRTGDAQ